MTRIGVLCTAMLFVATTDHAAHADRRAQKPPPGSGVVLVNGTANQGDLGTYEKLRRVLDSNNLLVKLDGDMQRLMDGRSLAIEDIESIRDAYVHTEYDTALGIVDQEQKRIIANAAAGDPLPPLATLQLWRGLIAIGNDEQDKAVEFFRAARRFDPTVAPDAAYRESPTVQRLLRLAQKDPDTQGKLKIELDGEPEVSVDGGKPQSIEKKLALDTGLHVVSIKVEGMRPYLEIVNIMANQVERIAPELVAESDEDRAARLVEDAASAPPGKARLKKANEISQLIGTKRFLYIEDMSDGTAKIRVYDVATARFSKTVDLDLTVSDSQIRRRIIAAVNPENMQDAVSVVVIERPEHDKKWYERWYVWVGAAALIGGGALGYHYLSQDPMTLTGP